MTESTDEFDQIIKRVVEGQVQDFLNAHPEILQGMVGWKTPPNKTPQRQLRDSIAKRVIRDLCSPSTKMRLKRALDRDSFVRVVEGLAEVEAALQE